MTIVEKIEKLCKNNGVSPTQMLKQLGLSTGLMTQWRNGQNPSNKSTKLIADYFDVTTDYLLNGESQESEKETVPADSQNGCDIDIVIKGSESTWRQILSQMSDESLIKLHDYTEYLLWKQHQVEKGSQ